MANLTRQQIDQMKAQGLSEARIKELADEKGLKMPSASIGGFLGKAAQDIFPKIKTLDFAFDSEILIMARLKGYKIKEIPIYWKNDLKSK